MTKQTCRTCIYLEPSADKKPFRKGYAYRCTWTMPEIPLPDSRLFSLATLNKNIGRMQPDEGTSCPCYVKRNRLSKDDSE